MIKNKERLIWIFLLVFVFSISFVNFKTDKFAYAQNSKEDGDFYYYYRLFQRVFTTLQQNFVDPEKVTTKNLMYGAIKGMLESTGDPFTFLLDTKLTEELNTEMSGRFGGVGLSISKSSDDYIMIVAPIEDTPAERAGILAGDTIVEIEGKSTKGITTDEAANLMRGKEGTKVNISIKRDGLNDPVKYNITRAVIEVKSVKYKLLEDSLGYVRITTFGDDTAKDLDNALKDLKNQGAKKLIVDLRNNPGGRLDTAIKVVDEFIQTGKIVYTRGRNKNEDQDFYASKNGNQWLTGDMIVLVNQYSASASEILSGALQDNNRAKLLGETTFGKFSVQYLLPLDQKDKTSFKLTVANYYTPNGRKLHGEGIKPDFVVVENTLTPENISALTEIRKGDYIERYVKKYPNESSDAQNISSLKQELLAKNIKPTDYLLERLLYNERNKGNYKEIVDLKYDKQLKAAIDYLMKGTTPKQDVEPKRDKDRFSRN